MPSLSYSSNALDNLSAFYRKKYIVFVEDSDDKAFWHIVFQEAGVESVYFKEAGGVEELEKYAASILEDNVDIVVARDCDYTDLLNSQHDHPRILYTYGYSFENSIYNPKSIAKTIAVYTRSLEKIDQYEEEVREWLEVFAVQVSSLVLYDLANFCTGRGLKVMGKNCTRFLKSNSSHLPCEDKIARYLNGLKRQITEGDFYLAQELVRSCGKEQIFIVRGHFLTNAVINYIKHKVSQEVDLTVTIPREMLYNLMMQSLTINFLYEKDATHLQVQMNQLLDNAA